MRGERAPRKVWRLERVQRIERPSQEVFDFFSDPWNLERITPPFLRFRIETPPPIEMRVGALIDYRLSLHGWPLRWRTRIEAFDPPYSFRDVQLRGPYQRWEHLHEFVEVSGGTEMRDRVEYVLPFGSIGELARPLFVRPALDRIFGYRREAVARLLAR